MKITRPVLSNEDKRYFMDLLKKYRQFDPDEWRMAVRTRSSDCASRIALNALCDILIESEELTVSRLRRIRIAVDSMDYGYETGVQVRGQMTPLKKITLDTLLKLLAAVLREKHTLMGEARHEAERCKDIMGEWMGLMVRFQTPIRWFGKKLLPLLRRI